MASLRHRVIRPDFDLLFSIVAMGLLLAGIYAARASVVPFRLFSDGSFSGDLVCHWQDLADPTISLRVRARVLYRFRRRCAQRSRGRDTAWRLRHLRPLTLEWPR